MTKWFFSFSDYKQPQENLTFYPRGRGKKEEEKKEGKGRESRDDKTIKIHFFSNSCIFSSVPEIIKLIQRNFDKHSLYLRHTVCFGIKITILKFIFQREM